VKDEDVKMEDVKFSVKKEEPASQSEQDEVKPVSPSKKRTATGKEDAEEAHSSDADEPPAKKARQKPIEKPKQKKGIAVKKTAAKTAVKMEPIEIDDEEEVEPRPAKKAKVAAKKASPKPAPSAQETEASDAEEEEPTKRKSGLKTATTKTKTTKAADSTPDAEAEAEKASDEDSVSDAESEEDEKPEVAAKVRAKVQSTLRATGKEAYPDWKAGDPVPYAALCTTFSKIELTTKRLEIMAHCSAFMRQVARLTPNDLQPTVLLMVGKLAADYAGIELGIGESLIMKAIGESTGRNLKIIKEDQQKIGDLGLVAAKSRQNQPTMFKPKPLTIRGVHEGLLKIATVEGQGAQGRKVDGIKKLLSSADTNLAKGQSVDITKDKGGPSEAKFIIRALEGKMRLGLADKTVQVSLAHAMVFHTVSQDNNKIPSESDLKKGEEVFKAVYNELPAYEVVVPALLKDGIWKLRENCRLQPGVPLKPMLAKPTKSIGEVLDRFEGKDFTCEYKYDGERAQIHFVSHDADEEFVATAAPAAGKSDRGISSYPNGSRKAPRASSWIVRLWPGMWRRRPFCPSSSS
jgi:DNA ligase-1